MQGLNCGKFRLTERIGKGGMAEVWRAWQADVRQDAAVKLLQPEMLGNEEVMRRFMNEARNASTIQNPGIVTIYDTGTADDGRIYIAMELLRGESLGDRLQRVGRLTLEASQRFLGQLARVMDSAHRAGILHRDLKPDNLFLVKDPEVPGGERIKVLDFGLAKCRLDDGPSLATSPNLVFGSPKYTAPEQCGGAAGVDERADIYSIGCVAYHCICGQPPFVFSDWASLIKAHQTEEPVAPKVLRPELSEDMDKLIIRLLARDRDQRIQSCAELLSCLQALAGDGSQFPETGNKTLVESDQTIMERLMLANRVVPTKREITKPIRSRRASSKMEAVDSSIPAPEPRPELSQAAPATPLDDRHDPRQHFIPELEPPSRALPEGWRGMPMYPSVPVPMAASPLYHSSGHSSLTGGAAQMGMGSSYMVAPLPHEPRRHHAAMWIAFASVILGSMFFFWLYVSGIRERTVVVRSPEVTPHAIEKQQDPQAPQQARKMTTGAMAQDEVEDLVTQCGYALTHGKPEAAWKLCHQVVTQGDSEHQRANELCAMSKCALGAGAEALPYYQRLVEPDARQRVHARCARDSVDLPEP